LAHSSFIHLAQKFTLFKIFNVDFFFFGEAPQHMQLDKPLAPQMKLIGKGPIRVSPTLHYIFLLFLSHSKNHLF
jgi:hypothetical protein